MPAAVQVPCSVTALASAMSKANSGDTLSLAAGCVYRQATLPAVTGNLTITGNGATLRDSGNLTVGPSNTLTVTGLNFRRTRIVITGAGRADITGGTFTGATGTDGGAIEDDSTSALGGLQVTGATFTGNTATFGGGAIYGGGNLGAIITDCAFYRNHAGAFGGAVVDDTQTGAVITGSLIAGNTAAKEGGGVASLGGGPDIGGFGASIIDSVITGNHAGFGGGGVYSTLVLTTITGSLISRNTASGDGGGVYYDENQVELDRFAAALDSDTITRNTAGGHGGGVYDNLWPVGMTGTQVTRNTAGAGGGGIYLASEWTVILATSLVERNRPDNCEPPGMVTGCTR